MHFKNQLEKMAIVLVELHVVEPARTEPSQCLERAFNSKTHSWHKFCKTQCVSAFAQIALPWIEDRVYKIPQTYVENILNPGPLKT